MFYGCNFVWIWQMFSRKFRTEHINKKEGTQKKKNTEKEMKWMTVRLIPSHKVPLFLFFFCFFWWLPQILTPFALFCFIFLCSHSWVCVALHVTNVFFYRTTWLTLESLVRIVRIVWNPVIWLFFFFFFFFLKVQYINKGKC